MKQNNGNERSSDRSKTSEKSKFADREYFGGGKKMNNNGVKEKDLFERSFVFDIYVMMTKNINLFSLERIIFDVKNWEMINMF